MSSPISDSPDGISWLLPPPPTSPLSLALFSHLSAPRTLFYTPVYKSHLLRGEHRRTHGTIKVPRTTNIGVLGGQQKTKPKVAPQMKREDSAPLKPGEQGRFAWERDAQCSQNAETVTRAHLYQDNG